MMKKIEDDSTAEQVNERTVIYTKQKKPLLQYVKIPLPEVEIYEDKQQTARELINKVLSMAHKVNNQNRFEAKSSGTKVSHADTYYTNKNISDHKKTATILTRENLIHGKPTVTVSFHVPDQLRDKVKKPTLNQMFSFIDPAVINAANLHSINYPLFKEESV